MNDFATMFPAGKQPAMDPFGTRSAQAYAEMGESFVKMLQAIDEIVAKLGGTQAARAVVTYTAREVLYEAKRRELDRDRAFYDMSRHLTLCDPWVVSATGYAGATQHLRDAFRLRAEMPLEHVGAFMQGQLAVRGELMFFEMPEASVLVGHCWKDGYHTPRHDGDERWSMAVTKQAEMLLDLYGLKAPRVGMTHSKSRAAAIKGLARIAEESFSAKLKPVAAAPAAA